MTDYVCLDCGKQFSLKTSILKKSESKCPYCGSERLLKMSPSSWYGFFGGGG